jgi:hypothetical protein
MTPGNATIATIPRWDAIFDTTCPDGCSYRCFLFSTDQSMTQKQLMEEASSYRSLKASGEGRVEMTFNSKLNPPSAHLVHLLLIHLLGRRLASKLLCWLNADRGGRERGLSDKHSNSAKYLIFWREARWNWKVSFPPRFFDMQRIKLQPTQSKNRE